MSSDWDDPTAPGGQQAAVAALGLRVLLAEDKRWATGDTAQLLHVLGCESTTASNGQQAVEYLEPDAYDIVLMDCRLPVRDGFSATAEIRRMERLAGAKPVPIVALSTDTAGGDHEQALRCGMDDYLARPYTSVELLSVLRCWSRAAQRGADDARPPGDDLPPTMEPGGEIDTSVLATLHALARPERPGVLQPLYRLFCSSAPELIEEMCSACAAHDRERLRVAAHSLKSSSANLGVTGVARQCQTLEADSIMADWAQLRSQCEDLRRLAPSLTRALQEAIARITGGSQDGHQP